MKRQYVVMGVLMALMLLAMPVVGASVGPVLVESWQSGNAQFECQQTAGFCEADYAYKIDDWGEDGIMDGKYSDSDSGNAITISNDDFYTFDWESTYPVCKVIVKAGTSAYVFYYDPAVTSDEGLYAPLNPAGKIAEISHVTFCFNEPEIPMTYHIHGPKYLFCTGVTLPGWTIVLEQFNENSGEFEPYGKTVTNHKGNYHFADVEPGKYRLSEEMQDHWTQVQHPEENYYIINVPGDLGKIYPNAVWYWRDFRNQPKLYTSDETAWAAQKNPGETRFVTQGNWGTYVTYDVGGGSESAPQKFPLYAGQNHLAGYLNVYDTNGKLYVTYDALGTGKNVVADTVGDYTIKWAGLKEYHLHVANTAEEIPRTPGRGRNAAPGNPIPGHFKYKQSFDTATVSSGPIEVDISKFNEDSIIIAAHAVMEWEGYFTEVYNFAIEKQWKQAWIPINELVWETY